MRAKRPFYIFALGIIAAIPAAWVLAGDSGGLGAMIVVIVLTVLFTALFEAIWRRLTQQK